MVVDKREVVALQVVPRTWQELAASHGYVSQSGKSSKGAHQSTSLSSAGSSSARGLGDLVYPQPPKTASGSTQSPIKRSKDAISYSELDKRIDDFLARLNNSEIEHSMFSKEQNSVSTERAKENDSRRVARWLTLLLYQVLRRRLHGALKDKLVRLEKQFAEKQRKLNELGLLSARMNKVRSHAMYRLAVNRDLRVEELQRAIVAKMEVSWN